MLQWDETDFLEYLEVLPEEPADPDEIWRRFAVERDGLRLVVELDCCDATLSLARSGRDEPLFRAKVADCPRAVWNRTFDRLEFLPAPEATWRTQLHRSPPCGYWVRVRPDLRIEPLGAED